jgi:hypothetical protein
MAEIKSTLEMALARAEKLAAAAAGADSEELLRKGMKLGADFLADKEIDLKAELGRQQGKDRDELLKGVFKTLLRNIVLPRDETLRASSMKAVKAISALAGNSGEIQTICGELTQILDQYNQHKEQTRLQLEDAIRNQLRQQMAQRGQKEPQGDINPAMHPQYRDELAKMVTSLNSQYNDAMDQRKAAILGLLQ